MPSSLAVIVRVSPSTFAALLRQDGRDWAFGESSAGHTSFLALAAEFFIADSGDVE